MYLATLVESQFNDALNSGKLVIALFGARWCPHCQATKPALRHYVGRRPEVIGIEVDCDRFDGLANRYHVIALPTVCVFVGGQPKARATGEMDETQISKLVGKAQEKQG